MKLVALQVYLQRAARAAETKDRGGLDAERGEGAGEGGRSRKAGAISESDRRSPAISRRVIGALADLINTAFYVLFTRTVHRAPSRATYFSAWRRVARRKGLAARLVTRDLGARV